MQRVGEAGDRLPGAPEYNFNASFQQSLSWRGIDGYLSGDYAYIGNFFTNAGETGLEVGDYGLFGLQLGATFDRVDVQLFGQNLGNEDAYTWGSVNTPNVYQLRPRTVGLRATYTW